MKTNEDVDYGYKVDKKTGKRIKRKGTIEIKDKDFFEDDSE